jgi:hypothetical protein
MKRILMAAGLTACLAGASAFGQTVGVGPADTIVVEPEQRTLIKEYVVKEKIAPVRVQERIAVGARLPADVELRTVPSAWGPKFSKYRYVYSDEHIYLVEPSNRTVIQVIDLVERRGPPRDGPPLFKDRQRTNGQAIKHRAQRKCSARAEIPVARRSAGV